MREINIADGYIVQDNNLLACSRGHIEKVFEMLEADSLKKAELKPMYDEIVELNGQVSEKESHIEELEKQIYEEQKKAKEGEAGGEEPPQAAHGASEIKEESGEEKTG